MFSITGLPHSSGVMHHHLLLRQETRILKVAPFLIKLDHFVCIGDNDAIQPWPLGNITACGPLQE